MNSKMLVRAQLGKYGIGNGTYAHLQACPILDQFGAMTSYSCFHLIRLAEMSRFERGVALDEYVNH